MKLKLYLLLAEFSVRTVNYGITIRTNKTRLIRCSFYGFFQFGGPEISAGRAIWQLFDRRQKRKFLLAHENNSTQQTVSQKVKTNSPCWKSLFGQD